MKTACIYHSIDLDGQMSAAIVMHWFKTMNEHVVIFDKDTKQHLSISNEGSTKWLDLIGYNYGQSIPDLSEYDKVIMCDISFPKSEMENLFDRLTDFIWIDHHSSAINDMFSNGERSIHPLGLQDTKFAACELTWKYFFSNSMPEIVHLLGRYDCFGHKGTEEEDLVLEFQFGARERITNVEQAYDVLVETIDGEDEIGSEGFLDEIWFSGSKILSYLKMEAKQNYRNGFEVFFHNEEQSGRHFEFICINKERFNPINFGIDYHADGYDGAACFHYDGVAKLWRFSLYNDNGLVDCSLIAKNYGGGGHKGAAGFVLTNEQFIKFIG